MNYPDPAPRRRRAIWPILVGIGVLGLLLCSGLALAIGISEPRTGVLPTVTPNPGTRPTADVPAEKATGTPDVIGEGIWEVGEEIQAGVYQTSGVRPDSMLCYWHSARDTGTSNIIDQGTATGPKEQGLVTLKKGQFFQTSGCVDWVRRD